LNRGEVDMDMLKHLSALGQLSVDVQGFVRVIRGQDMVYEDWPEKREALPLFDILKTDAAEAEVLTGETDIYRAAAMLAEWGAGEVVLTHTGGVLVQAAGKAVNAPFTARSLKGRTGRGDTCMSSYLAWRGGHSPEQAGRFAAAVCSIKMERPGPFDGTLEQVLERMKEQD